MMLGGVLDEGFEISRWSSRVRLLAQLAPKGFWAITDQGLFAGSNFVLSVVLARWLAPQGYGIFAVTFSTLLLVGTAHTALLAEPMLVYGSGRFRGSVQRYVSDVIRAHVLFTCVSAVALSTAVVLADRLGLLEVPKAPILSMLLASPGILFLWLMRRACYVVSQPQLAATAGAGYLLLMLTGVVMLQRLAWLDSGSAFILLGICSLSAGAWLARRLGIGVGRHSAGSLREIAGTHWAYGRWALATGALSWIPANIFVIMLAPWAGLEASAVLKASMNLVMPILHINGALLGLLLPALVRARSVGSLRETALVSLSVFVLGSVLYWAVVGLFGRQLAALLYGNQYVFDATLLWLIGGLPVVAAVGSVAGAVLKAYERPDYVFWAYLTAAVFALTAGLGLTRALGVHGAIAASIGASVTSGLAMGLLNRRRRTKERLHAVGQAVP